MLEDCLIESRRPARSKKPFTLIVSIVTHGSLVAGLVLVPLFQEQLLPHGGIFDPLRPPEVRTQAVSLVRSGRQASPTQKPPAPADLFIPLVIPKDIATIVDEPDAGPAGFPTVGPGGGGNSLNITGLIGLDLGPRVATPPPAPPPSPPPAPPKLPDPAPAPTAPIRRGGEVVMSNLVHQVQPVYPVLAQKTHTQGFVLLEAVIMRDGTIDPARVRVISGNVLLNEAAIEAVRQWRYKPTLLNREPVEILTTITINFTFS